MTKLSRLRIDPEKMNLFQDDLWGGITSLETKQETRDFFNQFLTHTERKMFAKRFQIVMMLLLGYDYAAIKSRVKVTDATIAKMSNWIEEEKEALISVAKRILSLKSQKKEKMKRPKGRPLPGDLLSPAAGKAADSAVRALAKRKKKSSISN